MPFYAKLFCDVNYFQVYTSALRLVRSMVSINTNFFKILSTLLCKSFVDQFQDWSFTILCENWSSLGNHI